MLIDFSVQVYFFYNLLHLIFIHFFYYRVYYFIHFSSNIFLTFMYIVKLCTLIFILAATFFICWTHFEFIFSTGEKHQKKKIDFGKWKILMWKIIFRYTWKDEDCFKWIRRHKSCEIQNSHTHFFLDYNWMEMVPKCLIENIFMQWLFYIDVHNKVSTKSPSNIVIICIYKSMMY